MISNLDSPYARDVDTMATPEAMLGMMREGYAIGLPLDTYQDVVALITPLLQEGEIIKYSQTCEKLMDILLC